MRDGMPRPSDLINKNADGGPCFQKPLILPTSTLCFLPPPLAQKQGQGQTNPEISQTTQGVQIKGIKDITQKEKQRQAEKIQAQLKTLGFSDKPIVKGATEILVPTLGFSDSVASNKFIILSKSEEVK